MPNAETPPSALFIYKQHKEIMEEKIYQFLRSQLGNTSVSERTIRRKAAKLAKTITRDEDLTPEAVADDVADLKEWSGELNHEVSAKVEEFRKNHKAQPTPESKAQPEEQKPDAATAVILEKLSALENSLKERDFKDKADAMRVEVKSKSGELKVSRKDIWDNIAATINVGTESTSESLLAGVKKTYEDNLKLYFGDGAKPYNTSSETTGVRGGKDDFKAFAEQLRAEGKLPQNN